MDKTDNTVDSDSSISDTCFIDNNRDDDLTELSTYIPTQISGINKELNNKP